MLRTRLLRPLAALALAVVTSTVLTAPPAAAEPFGGAVYNARTNPRTAFKINHYADYVPQGIAYGKGHFFQTQYNWRYPGIDSIIVVHSAGGAYQKAVYIAEGHVGGVAVRGNWLYVVTNVGGQGRLRTYSIDKILATPHGRYVAVAPGRGVVNIGDSNDRAGAFIGLSGKRIYFGSHSSDSSYTKNGRMWHYNIRADGKPVKPAGNTVVAVPPNVQGMAVSGSSYLFSQSWDRDCWSRFKVTGRERPSVGGKSIFGPSMAEDVATTGGVLFITYESAANKYNGGDGSNHARNPVSYVHAGDLSDFVYAVWSRGWTSVPSGSNPCA